MNTKSPEVNLELLASLCKTPGLPGREEEISFLIRQNIPSPWQTQQDALGNLIAHLPGKGNRLLILAHMDEVGLIVRRITPEGFLLVERLGGMHITALPGNRLCLWSNGRCVPAWVGLPPQHLAAESPIALKDIYIDVGAASGKETREMGIQIGDGLTWDSPLVRTDNDWVCTKALDDRLGCYILIALANLITKNSVPYDLYLAFVVQEETSTHSALPIIRSVNPDYALGIDGTLAFDSPDVFHQQTELQIGNGPAIKWMDAIRGKSATYLPDGKLAKHIQKTAQQQNIPLQTEIVSGLTTALNLIPFSQQGIKTAALSIPIRYHHSPVETACLSDVQHLIKLLLCVLSQPLNL